MKHKHYEQIIAFAEGLTIQYYDGLDDCWYDITSTPWRANQIFRVKPARVWPVTSFTEAEKWTIWHSSRTDDMDLFDDIANAAIRRYIEDMEKSV